MSTFAGMHGMQGIKKRRNLFCVRKLFLIRVHLRSSLLGSFVSYPCIPCIPANLLLGNGWR